MQLASNESYNKDISESEPILPQPDILQRSEESSSSCSSSSSSSSSSEITAVREDCVVSADDLQNLHVDETSYLVNDDQPQCRICLDIGGLYYLYYLVSFSFLILFEMVDFSSIEKIQDNYC